VTLLTVIGDLVEDIVVRSVGPTVVGTDNAATVTRRRGGSAATVAALAAPRTATRFIGRVGNDSIGSALVATLQATGCDVRVQRGGRTGTVVVIVDECGERTMFPDRAAAGELASIDRSWLADTALLHVPAYGFGEPASAGVLREAIAAVRSGGGRLAIDVSATSLIRSYGVARFHSLLAELRPDVVFANADEAALLDLVSLDPPAGCVWIAKQGAQPALVITHGPNVASVAAMPIADVRDTTGAGDAFAAGYLASSLGGADPVDAASAGHACAAEHLQAAL
jgi:sugar/nucleoside kinase (ribokinase family)